MNIELVLIRAGKLSRPVKAKQENLVPRGTLAKENILLVYKTENTRVINDGIAPAPDI